MIIMTIWILAFMVAVPMLVVLIVARRQPSQLGRLLMIGLGTSLPIAIAVLVLSRMNGIRLEGDTATVTAFGWHHAEIPASRLAHPDLVVPSSVTLGEWAPCLRLSGVGIPPYRGGWFRFCNGSRGFVLDDAEGRMLVYRDALASGGSLVISEHYVTAIGLTIETNASAATP